MNWNLALTDVVISDADVEAVLDCLRSGWLSMGPRTIAFEEAFADLHGGGLHAIAVSSGTAALHLALLAAGVGPGDEVLVPAFTFVAGAAAVRYCGASPVPVDSVGPSDMNLDPEDAALRVTPRTRAVLATHWMGYVCDLRALSALCSEHGLILVEDCAHAVTARDADGRLVGNAGAAGCFSFFSKKQLAVGEGGMVLTSDEGLADRVRSLRSHTMTSMTWDRHRGHAESYDVTGVGYNFRIDEPHAALGLSRLPRLIDDVARRRELVRQYRSQLADLPGVVIPWNDEAVERGAHFGFTVLLSDGIERDRIAQGLASHGIQTTWYPALTTLTEYADRGPMPRAESLSERNLVLPLASTYSRSDVESVVARLREMLVP
jgi:dTDP-4-amino-4,6-dideoxygalactose transaminase